MRRSFLPSLVTAVVLSTLMSPGPASAQDVERLGQLHGVRPPAGYYAEKARNPQAFEFQRAWFRRVRPIYQQRELYRRAANISALNAAFSGAVPSRAAGQSAASAVTGTFRVPVLLGNYSNRAAPGGGVAPFDSAGYEAKLFSPAAAPPYSATTYYSEVSRGLITLTGDAYGWFTTSMLDSFYEGPPGNNGLVPGVSMTGAYMTEMLVHFDSIVDFRQYDNDGPDGNPDSGDDDGFVDVVAFIHPEVGGECGGGTNMWAHRFVYRGWPETGGVPYTTNDIGFSGAAIMVDDYIIQSGLGGASGCTGGAIMPIGVFTHETGHAFDLPDLYDTTPGVQTFGVGHWDLMASGGSDRDSPSHLSSWSLNFLGWVAVDTLIAGPGFRSFNISPIQTADTSFVLCTSAVPANCFNEEHFFLENRQLLGSDLTSIPSAGLLIFHADPSIIGSCTPPKTGGCATNTVNREPDPGYDLEEADGLRHLNNYVNLGDAGDPYPGTSANTTFGPATNPSSALNDGTATNITVDSITQNPDSSIHVAISFNTVQELIQTNVAGTDVIVDGDTFPSPYAPFWTISDMHTIEVDSIQFTATGTRHVYQSWNDGGARSHQVTAQVTPDTFTATLNTEHQVAATVAGTGTGTISSSTPLDGSGQAWLLEGDPDTLVATADPGSTFLGWEGDISSMADTLIITMDQPYTVQATMGLPVSITSDSLLAPGVMGATFADTLAATGGSGSFVWSLLSGALPAGVVLDSLTGVLSGFPEEDGIFNFTARATSSILSDDKTFALNVSKPSLALNNVLDDLLTSGSTLTADERRFLDFLGNNNGRYDVGDLRAWLIDTGQLSPNVATDEVAETKAESDVPAESNMKAKTDGPKSRPAVKKGDRS